MRPLTRPFLVAGLLVALTACSGSAAESGFDLAEWQIAGPGEMSADTSSVDVSNSGSFPHTLVVTDSAGNVMAATDLIGPGESTELALDLDPGTYSFTCRIVAQGPEGEIVDHFEAGMNATVSVSE